jgi:hypothetical protein
MNVNLLTSDMIGALRERLKPYSHDGLRLEPEAVCALLRSLRTMQEMAYETEEELRIMQHQRQVDRDALRNRKAAGRTVDLDPNGNVVRLPTKRTMRPSPAPNGGGDAA